ncbi:MAG: TetR/AcrR family transcriptional regulator [Caulobacteraceae bacterium]|nr:TetR/AcrR family transcriptional regulator [Caulobacteraceae bacterium]
MVSAEEQSPRVAARRRQVLDAAIRCFRRHGFHATSMAVIAAEAGMSVGHIYRYFVGKDEIIQAIVREDVDEALAGMAELEATSDDVYGKLVEDIDRAADRSLDLDRAALMVEIRAEAARNPKVAEVVQAADRVLRANFARVLAGSKPDGWSDADIAARVEVMALIFDGVPLRVISHPDLDRAALFGLIQRLLAVLLERPSSAGRPSGS